ncbi:MAG TPA: DNA repair protein RecN [Prolixibacteraceae bacterium]|nr:DNA repair protein RecN [Prolixibacteraceae bacterium]
MLKNLSIRNYALIRELNVGFAPGLSVITGETGAGKSIILGALALILGQRADPSVLQVPDEKCIVEGRFAFRNNPKITTFFKENDLDYENPVLMRREITPSGKSRAFINDTPVSLNLMRELGLQLIDIHSQHANLELGKRLFQLNVLDWYGGHAALLESYSALYRLLRDEEAGFERLQEKALRAQAEVDYNTFQYQQLEAAGLQDGEQEELEGEQKVLLHSEEIKNGLSQVCLLLDEGEQPALLLLKEAAQTLQRLSAFSPAAREMKNRVESQYLELRDLADECGRIAEQTEYNPERLTWVNDRLDTLYSLQQKHRASSVEELIALRDELDRKLQEAASYDEELERTRKRLAELRSEVFRIAEELHRERAKLIPDLENAITGNLQLLGMPHAVFSVVLHALEEPTPQGTDEVEFLFSANKGVAPEEINKVASGGELSRLMLSIKTVVAQSKALPAIVFDEIDSGISGEIANRMADILKKMSDYMQVINITHLPQIAAKGEQHFHVYKNETTGGTETGMVMLDPEQRIAELAKMLSGDPPSPEALANARSLLRVHA